MNGAVAWADQQNCSLAEFRNRDLVHGQAAPDWADREPGQWIKDVYVQLESLGKLSPNDVVEITQHTFKLCWEDFEGASEEDFEGRKYEDLDEEEKEELEEASRDLFGVSRDEMLNIEQLNIDQFIKFCIHVVAGVKPQ